MAVELHTFVSEDAYYKVLKAFAAGAYDLVRLLTCHIEACSVEADFQI